jgi:hypothetical protein
MDPADEALVEAWRLGVENHSDEVAQRYEELLPTLIAAGYAESEKVTWEADFSEIWRYTPKGVARANELVPDDELF